MTDITRAGQGLTREAQLLLGCLRPVRDAASDEQIGRLSREGVDWERVLATATWNGVGPLVYRRLADGFSTHVPPPILERLRHESRQILGRNLLLLEELSALLRLLADDDIAAIPVKGVALGVTLYDDLGLRQSNDIDLFVGRDDVLRVKGLLLARGYRPEEAMTASQEATHLESDCELNFDRDTDSIHVEVHWETVPRSQRAAFGAERVWRHTVERPIGETEALTLQPETLFLFLCQHAGVKHSWAGLKWIRDIAEVVAVYEDMDWERVIEQARRLGLHRAVSQGLFLAGTLLGAPLPEEVSRAVGDDERNVSMAGLVCGRVFSESRMPGFREWRGYVEELETPSRRQTSALAGARYRLRYLRALMTPEFGDRESLNAPPWLSFLSHAYRPLRLLARHGVHVFTRSR